MARRATDPKPAFLSALAESGNVKLACQAARVSRSTVYEWRGEDPEFAAAWEAALAEAVESLEAEAYRRAVKGTLKPVFQGGKLAGKVREYSDTLLIFLMKGAAPQKYRDTLKHEGGIGVTMAGGVTIYLPENGRDSDPTAEGPADPVPGLAG